MHNARLQQGKEALAKHEMYVFPLSAFRYLLVRLIAMLQGRTENT